jgi:hypothetical protein
VFRTRRSDAATIEQMIAGIPGKRRYFVVNISKLAIVAQKQSRA